MATARPSLDDNPLETTVTPAGTSADTPVGDDTEYMTLNMGPSHPSTHGVLAILLETVIGALTIF